MKDVLTNPAYQELPTPSNISAYPTIIDIVEAIAETEEEKISSFSPLRRTILNRSIRPGTYFVMIKETESNE